MFRALAGSTAVLLAVMFSACATPATPDTPSGVGVVDTILTDPARADIADPAAARRWAVRVLYPACGASEPAPYAHGDLLSRLAEDGYFEQTPDVIDAWRGRTVGMAEAPACATSAPLVTLSIGLGAAGVNYSLLAERLAERGYVVAIVDHPYGGAARLSDGTILTGDGDPRIAEIDADPAVLSKRIAEWVDDIRFVADAAHAGDLAPGVVVGSGRVFAVGHSMGGAAAMDVCRVDPRFTACVDMDGAPFGSKTMDEGGHGDLLILHANPRYSDDDLAARGRTREQWDAMGAQFEAVWSDTFAHGDPDYVRVSVAGTGHMSFSDAPLSLSAVA